MSAAVDGLRPHDDANGKSMVDEEHAHLMEQRRIEELNIKLWKEKAAEQARVQSHTLENKWKNDEEELERYRPKWLEDDTKKRMEQMSKAKEQRAMETNAMAQMVNGGMNGMTGMQHNPRKRPADPSSYSMMEGGGWGGFPPGMYSQGMLPHQMGMSSCSVFPSTSASNAPSVFPVDGQRTATPGNNQNNGLPFMVPSTSSPHSIPSSSPQVPPSQTPVGSYQAPAPLQSPIDDSALTGVNIETLVDSMVNRGSELKELGHDLDDCLGEGSSLEQASPHSIVSPHSNMSCNGPPSANSVSSTPSGAAPAPFPRTPSGLAIGPPLDTSTPYPPNTFPGRMPMTNQMASSAPQGMMSGPPTTQTMMAQQHAGAQAMLAGQPTSQNMMTTQMAQQQQQTMHAQVANGQACGMTQAQYQQHQHMMYQQHQQRLMSMKMMPQGMSPVNGMAMQQPMRYTPQQMQYMQQMQPQAFNPRYSAQMMAAQSNGGMMQQMRAPQPGAFPGTPTGYPMVPQGYHPMYQNGYTQQS